MTTTPKHRLSRKGFRDWLMDRPLALMKRCSDCECPLGLFTGDSIGRLWISRKTKHLPHEYRIVGKLPRWAKAFVCNWDAGHGECGTGAEALNVLGSMKGMPSDYL